MKRQHVQPKQDSYNHSKFFTQRKIRNTCKQSPLCKCYLANYVICIPRNSNPFAYSLSNRTQHEQKRSTQNNCLQENIIHAIIVYFHFVFHPLYLYVSAFIYVSLIELIPMTN